MSATNQAQEWLNIPGDKCFRITSQAGHEIAIVYHSAYGEDEKGNADLLAASPLLLAALKAILVEYPPSKYRTKHHLPPALEQTIRVAIARAEGRS